MRLFVSSPADVMPERARVDAVAARLNGEFAGLAEIEVIRWETGFYTADRPFQQAIDEAIDRMHATDIVVCILWKRVGSKLDPVRWRKPDGSPYESGTVLEFETALAVSREQRGVPDVFLFRKDAAIAYSAANFEVERAQHMLLRTWPAAVAIIAEHAALIRMRHTLAPMAQDFAAADAGLIPPARTNNAGRSNRVFSRVVIR